MAEERKPKNNVFKIHIDDLGKVSYGPPAAWHYHEKDTVQFECNKGPFSVDYVPVTRDEEVEITPPRISPFGKDKTGELILHVESGPAQPDGTFRTAKQLIRPSKEMAEKLKKEHKKKYGVTFIETFRYEVTVPPSPVEVPESFGKQKNGMWIC